MIPQTKKTQFSMEFRNCIVLKPRKTDFPGENTYRDWKEPQLPQKTTKRKQKNVKIYSAKTRLFRGQFQPTFGEVKGRKIKSVKNASMH